VKDKRRVDGKILEALKVRERPKDKSRPDGKALEAFKVSEGVESKGKFDEQDTWSCQGP
jgi:hypothetical protein